MPPAGPARACGWNGGSCKPLPAAGEGAAQFHPSGDFATVLFFLNRWEIGDRSFCESNRNRHVAGEGGRVVTILGFLALVCPDPLAAFFF